ncbi:hypothetical protein SAMN00777080_3059 [Aquiflexum balticum DSM 16537]|uniref:Uncharacterized protein n=1 Tax=Aquiflexum balticum DSM 16537 TaxID=758820 RepID=A0A1W2H730_9BACT|nr:hypothetical protein [Aquiflexum balticum]SMD44438.1 hypothetical protein SAMN00777080_3059 [Aquiflexum balticum DSM 16537]
MKKKLNIRINEEEYIGLKQLFENSALKYILDEQVEIEDFGASVKHKVYCILEILGRKDYEEIDDEMFLKSDIGMHEYSFKQLRNSLNELIEEAENRNWLTLSDVLKFIKVKDVTGEMVKRLKV